MQQFVPCLWFNHQATEAANFYTSIFKNGKIISTVDNKDGVISMKFSLNNQEFVALNGGSQFTFTPAVSYFVNCETEDEVNALWTSLSTDGMILMEMGEYPFSKKFGWLQDKYGVSWQLNLSYQEQNISPFLLFVGNQYGKANEALEFYCSIFDNSKIETILHDENGYTQKAMFSLNGQNFMAMDSGEEHLFTFCEANSFYVYCETQDEFDMYWEKLSEGGEKSVCGWLKDKYGVSWVIVPNCLEELINHSDANKSQNVMDALLKMDKIDIQKLKDVLEQ